MDLSKWLQPVPRTAAFRLPGYNVWCGSMTRGEDGRYHLFYSRWPEKLGHLAWVTHSEVARAVADHPLGPYRHVEVVLPERGATHWDGSCTHNPTIVRVGKKYCLFYMGNYGTRQPVKGLDFEHRNHQRIGVATADRPEGPWRRLDAPILDVSPDSDAPDALVVTNPSVCVRPDGTIHMIYKAVAKKAAMPFGGPVVHLVATSPTPDGPYRKYLKPIFTKPGEHFAAEDPFLWHDGTRYRAIVKDNHGIFTGRGYSTALFESGDGFDWQLAEHPFVTTREVRWADGEVQKLDALERPQMYFEQGEPRALFFAAAADPSRRDSFNVAIPLRRPDTITDSRILDTNAVKSTRRT